MSPSSSKYQVYLYGAPQTHPARLRNPLLVAAAGFVIWASTRSVGRQPCLPAGGSGVTVTQARNYIAFQPASAEPATGFLFYPGGRVDYRSYAPALRAIAARGYTVVLAEMPLSLAVFRINAADAILPAFPEVKTWALGGHSLGGAMAARYTFTHPDAARGLVLWASFPASLITCPSTTLRLFPSMAKTAP